MCMMGGSYDRQPKILIGQVKVEWVKSQSTMMTWFENIVLSGPVDEISVGPVLEQADLDEAG